jgi:hypothetical protein
MSTDLCGPHVTDGNVGLAFGLVAAAGLSTTLGAALAFVMPYKTGAKNLLLASMLGIAAGVMLYVSFVEIFAAKSVHAFEACVEKRFAYLYATLCFFGGLALTWCFDQGLHVLEGYIGARRERNGDHVGEPAVALDAVQGIIAAAIGEAQPVANHSSADVGDANGGLDQRAGGGDGPVGEIQGVGDRFRMVTVSESDGPTTSNASAGGERMEIFHEVGHDGHMIASVYGENAHDSKRLVRMGMFAGIGTSRVEACFHCASLTCECVLCL